MKYIIAPTTDYFLTVNLSPDIRAWYDARLETGFVRLSLDGTQACVETSDEDPALGAEGILNDEPISVLSQTEAVALMATGDWTESEDVRRGREVTMHVCAAGTYTEFPDNANPE